MNKASDVRYVSKLFCEVDAVMQEAAKLDLTKRKIREILVKNVSTDSILFLVDVLDDLLAKR